ncbi:MAG: hypothetical protein EZS28_018137 [Streblomastix strix]|uniref:Uncharacterized protein n=1 Tax=Streblomastix strix TaxID=222440 RepID=A0A5J4VVP0_9EUKA|nr:MAG: hypothetical protein EZS28_018137 [Streblomastix strix]
MFALTECGQQDFGGKSGGMIDVAELIAELIDSKFQEVQIFSKLRQDKAKQISDTYISAIKFTTFNVPYAGLQRGNISNDESEKVKDYTLQIPDTRLSVEEAEDCVLKHQKFPLPIQSLGIISNAASITLEQQTPSQQYQIAQHFRLKIVEVVAPVEKLLIIKKIEEIEKNREKEWIEVKDEILIESPVAYSNNSLSSPKTTSQLVQDGQPLRMCQLQQIYA